MAAPDRFAIDRDSSALAQLLGPVTTPIAFTANDAADLPTKPRAIHCAVAGTWKYTANGVTVGPVAIEVGWHPVSPDRIWATGTTATLELWQ